MVVDGLLSLFQFLRGFVCNFRFDALYLWGEFIVTASQYIDIPIYP